MSTGASGPGTEGRWWHELGRSTRACPQCGSENIQIVEGEEECGSSPDGGVERRLVRAVACMDCGETVEF